MKNVHEFKERETQFAKHVQEKKVHNSKTFQLSPNLILPHDQKNIKVSIMMIKRRVLEYLITYRSTFEKHEKLGIGS